MAKTTRHASRHERACDVTRQALALLGVPEVRDSFFHAKQAAFKRFAFGATEAELLEVAAYARTRWDAGDRALTLKALDCLWGRDFAAVLAAARADAAQPVWTSPEDWGLDYVPRESDAEFVRRAGIRLDDPPALTSTDFGD